MSVDREGGNLAHGGKKKKKHHRLDIHRLATATITVDALVRNLLSLPPEHPVDLPDLVHVLRHPRAVLHEDAQLLHLRQRPPVEVGAAHVEVPPVGDPQLGVEDAGPNQRLEVERAEGEGARVRGGQVRGVVVRLQVLRDADGDAPPSSWSSLGGVASFHVSYFEIRLSA